MKIKFKKRYLILGLSILIGSSIAVWNVLEYAVLPLPAYYLLSDLPSPQPSDKVMVISPHPDDETLGAAGFIMRSVSQEASIKIVIVTDGNKHGLKNIRHLETIKAMNVLGIKEDQIVFLDFPDGGLNKISDQVDVSIDQIIKSYSPTIILSTHPADIHPDHAVVGRSVDASISKLSVKPAIYRFLVHYHRYPRPDGFHPYSFLLPPVKLLSTNNPWSKLTLDPEEQTLKNEAVLQYKSQLSHKNPFLRGLLLSFIRQNELFSIYQPK